jgi:4-amino-4-deoxy-L-arabinose transferase-like glycosyltransferase
VHPETLSGSRALALLAAIVYLVLALYLSRYLLTWDDEGAYLAIGYLATTGEVSLYEDNLTGQRMPLPFYVLGASQVVFGRNLWAARLLSAALGLAVLALTIAVAGRLAGPAAGAVAGLLLATQGVVVGYYATATYHALTALILLATLRIFLQKDLTARYALGAAVASLLFWTRTTMFPVLPFLVGWALLGARTTLERWVVIGVAAASPAAFFLSNPTHLKLLANFPIVDRFVAPLGYLPIFSLSAIHHAALPEQLWAFVLFARRYESWTLAAAGILAVAACLRALSTRHVAPPRELGSRDATIVAALLIWIVAWHLVIFRANFRLLIAYFPSFAPIVPILLGVAFARQFSRADLLRPARAALAVALAGALTISIVSIRHPLLPGARIGFSGPDTIDALARASGQLRTLVPQGERVFLLAGPVSAYLAGLNAPPQQFVSPGGTLAPEASDPKVVAKSGVWGMVEIDRWLGDEMRYALVSEPLLRALETARPVAVARIRELLKERFALLGRVEGPPWLACDVYRRRT